MKKNIAYCIPILLGMWLSSCKVVEKSQYNTADTAATQPPVRQHVPGMEGIIVLRPVVDSIKSGSKVYFPVYDYINQGIHLMDTAYCDSLRRFLPIQIDGNKTDSLKKYFGRAGVIESPIITPLSTFTPETIRSIAKSQGLVFDDINSYQFGLVHNVNTEKGDFYAARILMDMLQNKIPQVAKTTRGKLDNGRLAVTGAQTMLTKHPVENTLKGKGNENRYAFYDYGNRTIYVTDKESIYKAIGRSLPLDLSIKNCVLVQGMGVDPVVSFNQESLDAIKKDLGLEVGSYNNYIVIRITSLLIVRNYPALITYLQEQISPAPPKNKPNNYSPPPSKNQPPPQKKLDQGVQIKYDY